MVCRMGLIYYLESAAIQVTPGAANTAGGCWYQFPFAITTSFLASFTIKLAAPFTSPAADGFAFVRACND